MYERNVRHDEEQKRQAQVEDLHDRAVDTRQRRQVFLPVEDAPKEEMKNSECKMEGAACNE